MFRFPQNTFSFLSSFLLITQLSFSLSSRSDSNPILAYDRQVREGHLYSGNSFIIEASFNANIISMINMLACT